MKKTLSVASVFTAFLEHRMEKLGKSRNITDAQCPHSKLHKTIHSLVSWKRTIYLPNPRWWQIFLRGYCPFQRILQDFTNLHFPEFSPVWGSNFGQKPTIFWGFKNPFSASFLIPQTSRPSQTDRGEASTGTVLLSYLAIPNPIMLSSFNHLSMDKSGYPVCLMSPHQKSSPKWVICVINTKNHPKSTLQNHPLHETKTHPPVKTGYQHAPSCAGSKIWIPPAKPMSPWLNSKRSWQTPRRWSKRDWVRVVMEFWSEVMFGCFLQTNSPGQTTHVAPTDFVRLHFFD